MIANFVRLHIRPREALTLDNERNQQLIGTISLR